MADALLGVFMKTTAFAHKDGFGYGVRRLLGSRFYLFFVTLCIFIAHTLAAEIPIALFLMVPTLLGFLFAEDLRFLIPLLLRSL